MWILLAIIALLFVAKSNTTTGVSSVSSFISNLLQPLTTERQPWFTPKARVEGNAPFTVVGSSPGTVPGRGLFGGNSTVIGSPATSTVSGAGRPNPPTMVNVPPDVTVPVVTKPQPVVFVPPEVQPVITTQQQRNLANFYLKTGG